MGATLGGMRPDDHDDYCPCCGVDGPRWASWVFVLVVSIALVAAFLDRYP